MVDCLPIEGSSFSASTDEAIMKHFNSPIVFTVKYFQKAVGILRIAVRDSGKGFAAEEQEKISTDLLHFNGRELQSEGNVYTYIHVLIARILSFRISLLYRQIWPIALDRTGDSQAASGCLSSR